MNITIRIKMFEDEIAKPVLDLKKIREISFYGKCC